MGAGRVGVHARSRSPFAQFRERLTEVSPLHLIEERAVVSFHLLPGNEERPHTINLLGREKASALRFEQSVDQTTRIAFRVRAPPETPWMSTEREAGTIPR